MKPFKDIAEEYQEAINEAINEAKFKKVKKWKPDAKGNLKKVLVKQCQNSDGGKAAGFKVVDGKKCVKMSPDEIKTKKKSMKKAGKTKMKHSGKIARKAAIIKKKKISKGLIADPENQN